MRLIKHRVVIQDDAVSVPQIAEASAEEQKLVFRVIEEIQGYERASLEDLSSREVEHYVLELGRIAEKRSRHEIQQAGITAEKADELLNELVEEQMAERELPGLRVRRQIGAPSDSISFGDLYEHERPDITRYEPDRWIRDRLPARYGYGRRQERRDREYQKFWGEDYGPSRPPGSPMPGRRIADDVIARLEERIGSQARNVHVFVENRIVVLQGTVYDGQISNIARDIAERIVGPARVLNLIHVGERDPYLARLQDAYGSGYRGREPYGRLSRYRGLAHRREEDEEDERDRYERGHY
jgi:hypothetical protein